MSVPSRKARYIEERNKRLRPEGLSQFLKLADFTQFKYLEEDPWVDHAAYNARAPALNDGDDIKFLVLGAGYGGLLFAVHLIEAGFNAADIRIVDVAGGFGELHLHAPLLEETGHMPQFRYAYGPELREHAKKIAEKWGLTDKALFRTHCHTARWDDAAKRWIYVFEASGTLNAPQIPRLPGFDSFKGQHFHTSRWNYEITGGTDVDWTLDKLKDKRLAKWVKHLCVFQRPPSSVDERGQRPPDPAEWTNKIASTKGWQLARSQNFNSCLINEPIGEDLVDDGWCRTRSYCAVTGAPGIVVPEKIPEYIARLHAYDVERAEKIQARTSEIVKDPVTADKLKHWYPAWCKRLTFHDDYLPAFNLPMGVEALTDEAVVVDGKPYPIDVLVLSTGFALAVEDDSGTPGQRAGMKVFGREGLDMDDKWTREGMGTLHGVASHDFPNLFFPGPLETGVTANFTFTLSILASHVANILAEAERRAGQSNKFTVEVMKAAEEEWGGEVLKRAAWFGGCAAMKAARGAPWGEGIVSFTEVLKAWKTRAS
ncbi:Phenylacetone monooxygenase [Mycena venus]|uniref:Phenylacetone monooxygenase n=1 Tax=Mycena venus TaxID=2733690 RepID=A0A8H6YU34_9AGAR|nr:Phenylacetone monooxygenase [Mycena venus]